MEGKAKDELKWNSCSLTEVRAASGVRPEGRSVFASARESRQDMVS